MRTNITNLSKSFMLIALILIMGTMDSFSQKRVLIEQHTGAWCGWCPDGSVRMDALIAQYPNNVIGVKWHNGDAMAIPEQAQFSQTFGITGYPTGTVDRKVFNGKISLDRGAWAAAAVQSMNSENVVDVAVDYSFNSSTNMITAKVTATVLKNDNRQMALNVFIIEDNVTGSGSGYDQSNYFAGNSSFPNHEYYSQPAKIVGYSHMKVVRKVLGGVYGSTKVMPTSVKAGDVFTETFTYAKESGWKAKDMSVVAVVQAFQVSGTSLTDGSIINAVEAGREEIRVKLSVIEPHKVLAQGTTANKTIKIENTKNVSINVKIEPDGTTPAGWYVNYPSGTVGIPANGSRDVNLEVTVPSGAASFAEFKFKVIPSPVGDANPITSTGSFTALTNNAQYINFGLNANMTYFHNIMSNLATQKNKSVLLPYNEEILKGYPANLFKFVGISSPFGTRGIFATSASESQTLRDYIKDAIASGTRIFMSNELEIYNTFNWAEATADAKALFNQLGITGLGGDPIPLIQTNSQGQITAFYKINVKGKAGDAITDNMNFEVNALAASDASKRIFYCENMNLNTQIATPILNYVDGNGSEVGIAGARIQLPTTRAVYLSYCFEATADASKQKLAENIITWLFAEQVPDGPKVAVSTNSVSFGSVDIDKSKEMEFTISNNGDEALTIFSIMKTGSSAFEFTKGNETQSIPAGQSVAIGIKFSPDDASNYSGSISISSNGKNEQSTTVNLTGTGNPSSSVAYGTTPNGVLTMSMTPNPVVDNSQFNYTVNGDANHNVRIYVMNVAGQVVSELVNSTVSAGTYNMNFSNNGYVSGTYYIMAEVDGSQAQIPVVIVK